MKMTIKSSTDYKTTEWSGGKTTELFIYPPDGDYAARRFDVRISSATVEVEHSVFTSLPGVQRKLMLLEGEMKLVHKGHRERVMRPFADVDAFPGEWETESYGKVRDFNLMTCNGAKGRLSCVEAEGDTDLLMPEMIGKEMIILYVIAGSGKINDHELGETEIMVIEDYSGETIAVRPAAGKQMKLAVSHLAL